MTGSAGRTASATCSAAPRSPTTTGKVERWHKTLRTEFLNGKVFADVDEAQAAVDAWVWHYNHERPHQGIGMYVSDSASPILMPSRVRCPNPLVP